MKAFVRDSYGSPDVLDLRDVDKPVAKDGEMLVRVRASSLNQGDLDYLYGRPFLTRMGVGLRKPRIPAWGSTSPGRSRRSARTSGASDRAMRCSGT